MGDRAEPIRGTVKRYDPSHRHGTIEGKVARYWFHADAHCAPTGAFVKPVLAKAPMRREPKEGDQLVFFPTSSCSGLKALKWAFADAYDQADAKMRADKAAARQMPLLRP